MATTVEEHPIEGSVAMDSRNLQTEVGTPTAAPSGAIATDAAPANAGEEITREERYRRLRAVIKPDLDPSLVWPTLRDRGWACKPGRGLVSYYIVCSKFADESVAFMLKNAVRGDEYFCSEDELKVFCREKLGWVGTGGSATKRDDVPPSTGEDSEEEEAEEHWNLIAIHRASDIRDGKYKCAGCRRLTACSVWIKGGSFGDQWHCCVDCQSIHFDLKGKAFPAVKSGELPSSLDAISDSHRTIVAEMCSTEFRSDQILDDVPTKAVSTSPRTASSASYPRSLLKTPAPARRATTSTSASKINKTPKKQSAARSKKAKKAKKAEKAAKTGRKNQNSIKAKKVTSTPTTTDAKTLECREKPDRTSSSCTNTTTVASREATGTRNEPRDEGPITSEERYRRLGSLIKPDMDPSLVWPTLNDHGWACESGKGLVSYYFVCSKSADKSLQFILENALRGSEYFCSESEVREFCRD